MPSTERPIYPSGFNFIDSDIDYIAKYLFDNLNITFYDALKDDIVKTYRTFNDIYIPLTDFPCLKVYSTNEEQMVPYQPATNTTLKAQYILAFTRRTLIADLSRFISKEIIRLLIDSTFNDSILFQLSEQPPISVEYDVLLSPENTVYRYTTVNFSVLTELSV